jgi:protein-disulfide isomerase
MSKLKIPVNKKDHQTGNPGAKIILVEYGDYQCPHCGMAYPLIKRLLTQFKTDLLFIFRNFPLQEIHPEAMLAAAAAEAAGRQNKFWEMHDLIFEHQNSLSGDFLIQSAEGLHLNMDQFAADSNSEAILSRVENDFEGGIRSGVNGTPSFFLNGNRLNSYNATYESLAEAVRNGRKM